MKPKGSPPRKLYTKDLIVGTGATAEKGDEVSVNYVGELYSNGKIFDSSWKDTPGSAFGPFTLGAGAVIPGWDQGLVGMKVGGRRELIIPPSLAYGSKGSGSTIPAERHADLRSRPAEGHQALDSPARSRSPFAATSTKSLLAALARRRPQPCRCRRPRGRRSLRRTVRLAVMPDGILDRAGCPCIDDVVVGRVTLVGAVAWWCPSAAAPSGPRRPAARNRQAVRRLTEFQCRGRFRDRPPPAVTVTRPLNGSTVIGWSGPGMRGSLVVLITSLLSVAFASKR